MLVTFDCRSCGEQNEVDVVIDSRSSPGIRGGAPWDSEPGEGCQWHIDEDVKCESCSTLHTTDWFDGNKKFDEAVQEREAQPHDDY